MCLNDQYKFNNKGLLITLHCAKCDACHQFGHKDSNVIDDRVVYNFTCKCGQKITLSYLVQSDDTRLHIGPNPDFVISDIVISAADSTSDIDIRTIPTDRVWRLRSDYHSHVVSLSDIKISNLSKELQCPK